MFYITGLYRQWSDGQGIAPPIVVVVAEPSAVPLGGGEPPRGRTRFGGKIRRHTTDDPPKVAKKRKRAAPVVLPEREPFAPLVAPSIDATAARELAERLANATSDAARRAIEQEIARREQQALKKREQAQRVAEGRARIAARREAAAEAEALRLDVDAHNRRVLAELLVQL